jgi:hypothetical protein
MPAVYWMSWNIQRKEEILVPALSVYLRQSALTAASSHYGGVQQFLPKWQPSSNCGFVACFCGFSQ